MAKLLAATRDASWFDCPNTSSVKKYHIVIDGLFACGSRSLPDEYSSTDAATVPTHRQCKKLGCKNLFSAQKAGKQ